MSIDTIGFQVGCDLRWKEDCVDACGTLLRRGQRFRVEKIELFPRPDYLSRISVIKKVYVRQFVQRFSNKYESVDVSLPMPATDHYVFLFKDLDVGGFVKATFSSLTYSRTYVDVDYFEPHFKLGCGDDVRIQRLDLPLVSSSGIKFDPMETVRIDALFCTKELSLLDTDSPGLKSSIVWNATLKRRDGSYLGQLKQIENLIDYSLWIPICIDGSPFVRKAGPSAGIRRFSLRRS